MPLCKKETLKKNLLHHSEIKVRLLGEYLKRYLNIISNDGYTQKIKVYDLFCGEGIYENRGEGSPLVILRAVKDMHFINVARSNRFPKIDCQFNDLDKKKIGKVESVIREKSLYYPDFGDIIFTNFDYQEEIKKIIEAQNYKNTKRFVFIDPYGYKHIKARDIKNLLAKRDTEVLFFTHPIHV